jgi:hypothetical protein
LMNDIMSGICVMAFGSPFLAFILLCDTLP